MKVAVFADGKHQRLIEPILKKWERAQMIGGYRFYVSYDDFLDGYSESGCRIALVAGTGALGMEAARAAKLLLPHIPLIWFAEDEGFGPESYRVGCSFFSAAPITEELLNTAFEKCRPERRI